MATVKRADLLAALDAVRPGLAAKDIAEQSMSFLFSGGRVAAYDDRVIISHADAGAGIEGAVQGVKLHAILEKMKDEEVKVAASGDELTIAGKRAHAGLALEAEVSAQAQAALAEIHGKKKWAKLPGDFVPAARFCLFSAGGDMTKPVLTCLHLAPKYVESCDNFRLTRRELEFGGEALFPAAAAATLLKYEPTRWAQSEGWLHFTNEAGTLFSARTVAGEYPDLGKLITKGGQTVAMPDGLAAVLDRAAVFLDEAQGDKYVTVSLAKSWMTVSARSAGGWFKERGPAEWGGEPLEFMVVPQFLADMLPILTSAQAAERTLTFRGGGFIHVCTIAAPAPKEDKK